MVKWATKIWATEKWATENRATGKNGNEKLGNQFTVNGIPLKESTRLYDRSCHSLCLMSSRKIANVSGK